MSVGSVGAALAAVHTWRARERLMESGNLGLARWQRWGKIGDAGNVERALNARGSRGMHATPKRFSPIDHC
jgi:hypothetical protein